jgi:protein TonB
MTAVAIRYSPVTALSLPRIGAWSASLTIHIVALALLLSAPVAYQFVNRAQKEEPTVVDLIVEKPVPVVEAIPPPPTVVHHEKHTPHPVPSVADPVPTTERTALSTDATETVTPTAIDAVPSQPMQPDTEPTAIAYGSHASVPYPRDSLKAHEQGTVMLLVLVGPDGKVEDIRIEKSSGYTRLDRAARDAVKLWNFNPARHGGVAERAWAKVPISFTLSTL